MTAPVRGTPVSSSVGGGATTLSVTAPTHSDGDAILVAIKGAVGAGTLAISAPDGTWTEIGQIATGTFTLALFVKVAASEPASWTFTYDTTASQRAAIAVPYSGSDESTPQDATPSENSGNSSTATATGITTATADAMLVCAVAGIAAVTFSSSDLDEAADANRMAFYDQAQASAGASGDKSITVSASTTWLAIMGAVKPETGGGGAATPKQLAALGVG